VKKKRKDEPSGVDSILAGEGEEESLHLLNRKAYLTNRTSKEERGGEELPQLLVAQKNLHSEGRRC